jgi:hypothetical protein
MAQQQSDPKTDPPSRRSGLPQPPTPQERKATDPGATVASEEQVDETSDESFPASDPPSWTMGKNTQVGDTGKTDGGKTAKPEK